MPPTSREVRLDCPGTTNSFEHRVGRELKYVSIFEGAGPALSNVMIKQPPVIVSWHLFRCKPDRMQRPPARSHAHMHFPPSQPCKCKSTRMSPSCLFDSYQYHVVSPLIPIAHQFIKSMSSTVFDELIPQLILPRLIDLDTCIIGESVIISVSQRH